MSVHVDDPAFHADFMQVVHEATKLATTVAGTNEVLQAVMHDFGLAEVRISTLEATQQRMIDRIIALEVR